MSIRLPANLSFEVFSRSIRLFDVEASELRLLGTSQNFVYGAFRHGRKAIVRVSTQRHRSQLEIEGELLWIEFLAERRLPVCPPFRSNSQRLCELVEVQGQTYLITVFPCAPGRKPERIDLTDAFCEKVGRLAGQLHQAARGAERSVMSFSRKRWSSSRLLKDDFDSSPAQLSVAFRTRVAMLIKEIDAQPATHSNFGMLHGDVNMGNLHLEDDGSLWIFDFDNCEYGFYAQDLVTMLYDSLYSKVVKHVPPEELTPTVKRFWGALLRGYREAGGVAPCDPETLFRFFLMREAVLYVHYHRILPAHLWADPFLAEMKQHVEDGWHPLAVRELGG